MTKEMKKMYCQGCDYVYDPEIGDVDNGVQPRTAFDDLPKDWVCPACSMTQEDFLPYAMF